MRVGYRDIHAYMYVVWYFGPICFYGPNYEPCGGLCHFWPAPIAF